MYANTTYFFTHIWKKYKVNRALLESAQTLSNVKIHNLNETYKDGVINAENEVALLKYSQKIIFQFPLFWFSTPALMKEWQDRVLTHILYGKEF